tara:strand:- start:355 stop:564 length:210 start_codon:yes stop_codon:yes gene_type:complete
MSKVFVAVYRNQIVVVKKLEGLSYKGLMNCFAEIYLLSRLRHENVIGVFGSVYEKSRFCMVLEYAKNKR